MVVVFAAVAENEQAEKSFKRSPDPCTDLIDMRTTFHGQLNFPSSSAKSFPPTSQTIPRDTLLVAKALSGSCKSDKHEFAFCLLRFYSSTRKTSTSLGP